MIPSTAPDSFADLPPIVLLVDGCLKGCGLYCFDRDRSKWVKLA